MPTDCLICQRVALSRDNPFFIHEFPRSILVVGDHQFHKGYAVLLLKDHVREMHELSPQAAADLMGELMSATRAVVKTFKPWKINHACYGNAVPHIHWHIYPQTARAIAQQVRANL